MGWTGVGTLSLLRSFRSAPAVAEPIALRGHPVFCEPVRHWASGALTMSWFGGLTGCRRDPGGWHRRGLRSPSETRGEERRGETFVLGLSIDFPASNPRGG